MSVFRWKTSLQSYSSVKKFQEDVIDVMYRRYVSLYHSDKDLQRQALSGDNQDHFHLEKWVNHEDDCKLDKKFNRWDQSAKLLSRSEWFDIYGHHRKMVATVTMLVDLDIKISRHDSSRILPEHMKDSVLYRVVSDIQSFVNCFDLQQLVPTIQRLCDEIRIFDCFVESIRMILKFDGSFDTTQILSEVNRMIKEYVKLS